MMTSRPMDSGADFGGSRRSMSGKSTNVMIFSAEPEPFPRLCGEYEAVAVPRRG